MPSKNPPKLRSYVGSAEFINTKKSKYSEGWKNKTNYSSSQPVNEKKGVYSTNSEPARQSRLGKQQTASGPKSRKKGK